MFKRPRYYGSGEKKGQEQTKQPQNTDFNKYTIKHHYENIKACDGRLCNSLDHIIWSVIFDQS